MGCGAAHQSPAPLPFWNHLKGALVLVFISIGNFFWDILNYSYHELWAWASVHHKQERLSDHDHDHDVDNVPDDDDDDHLDGNVC